MHRNGTSGKIDECKYYDSAMCLVFIVIFLKSRLYPFIKKWECSFWSALKLQTVCLNFHEYFNRIYATVKNRLIFRQNKKGERIFMRHSTRIIFDRPMFSCIVCLKTRRFSSRRKFVREENLILVGRHPSASVWMQFAR